MKNTFARIFVVFNMIFTLMLVFPAPVHAQSGTGGDKLVLGQSFTLESGQIQDGSIVVFGGTVRIKDGAQVNGDIFIAGGSLDLQGRVKGTVTSMGSVINVGDTAVIEKDLSSVGGTVTRSEKALIQGRVDISSGDKIDFARPTDVIKSLPYRPILFDMGPIADLFGLLTRVLGLTVLAAFMALFLFKPIERVADTAVSRPMMSFFIGLLSVIVVPALMALLIITLILSPFGLLGFIMLGVAMLFGWIAIGYEVGKRIALSLKVEWAAPVVTGLGVLVLSLVSELINFNDFIRCIGWLLPAFISLLGLGAVVISRFGTGDSGHPAMPVQPGVQVVDRQPEDNQPENPVV